MDWMSISFIFIPTFDCTTINQFIICDRWSLGTSHIVNASVWVCLAQPHSLFTGRLSTAFADRIAGRRLCCATALCDDAWAQGLFYSLYIIWLDERLNKIVWQIDNILSLINLRSRARFKSLFHENSRIIFARCPDSIGNRQTKNLENHIVHIYMYHMW